MTILVSEITPPWPAPHRTHEHAFSKFAVGSVCGRSVRRASLRISCWYILHGVVIALIALYALSLNVLKKTDVDSHENLVTKIILIVVIVFSIFNTVFGVILFIGVTRDISQLVKAWIVYAIFSFVFLTCDILYLGYYSYHADHRHAIALVTIFKCFLYELHTIYFVLIVNSRYWEIKREQSQDLISA